MRVDRGDVEVDTVVDKHVGKCPRHPVDVMLAGDANRRLQSLLQLALARDQPFQPGVIDIGRHMPAQRREPDPPLMHERGEAIDLVLRGSCEPAPDGLRRLACPLRATRLGQADGLLEPVDRLAQILQLELPDDGLRVRVADVEVTVMEKKNLLHSLRGRRAAHEAAATPLQPAVRSPSIVMARYRGERRIRRDARQSAAAATSSGFPSSPVSCRDPDRSQSRPPGRDRTAAGSSRRTGS